MTNEELLQQIRNGEGDDRTLTTLWGKTAHLFYIHSDGLYRRHKSRADSCGVECDDCRQVCWFAFLDAIKAYNAKLDAELKFSTFIKFHVRRRVYELLGYRTSKQEPLNGAISLDAPLPGSEDVNLTVGDTIADLSAGVPYEEIDGSDIAAEVESIISALPPKQAAAVRGRFWQDKALTEVGAELGLTPKQIHNQYREAIRKLRRDKRLQEIRGDYYNCRHAQNTLCDCAALDAETAALGQEIGVLEALVRGTILASCEGSNEEGVPGNGNPYIQKLDSAIKRQKELESLRREKQIKRALLDGFIRNIEESGESIGEFDERLWAAVTEKVTVMPYGALVFSFKDGTDITIREE